MAGAALNPPNTVTAGATERIQLLPVPVMENPESQPATVVRPPSETAEENYEDDFVASTPVDHQPAAEASQDADGVPESEQPQPERHITPHIEYTGSVYVAGDPPEDVATTVEELF
jgi:hypothetical protein